MYRCFPALWIAWPLGLLLVVLMVAPGPAVESSPPSAPSLISPLKLQGRGVYYIQGRVRSPVAGIGSRADDATNRLVLDDAHSSVVVDRSTHRITLRNDHRYGLGELVACLLLLGEGVTESGQEVPVAVHLKIKKSLDHFTTSLHPHPTVRDLIVRATFEPFEVVLRAGETETIALTPEQAVEAVRDPVLTARIANQFMQVTDHLESKTVDPALPDAALVDLSFGFGSEKLNMKLARVRLVSKSSKNAALIRGGSVGHMLEKGDWEFRVDSLSPYIPKWYFERDFFLFGIEDLSAIEQIAKRGLLRGETLIVGYRNGEGYIGVGDRRSKIPDPADVARSYLEFHFVGGVVARQLAELPGRLE
jgi:hypothetical protein